MIVCFTHDSLLQTLQVLFGLLMALVQESDRKSRSIIKDKNMSYLYHNISYWCIVLSALYRNLRTKWPLNTYESSSRRSLLVLSWLFRRSKSARIWASSSSSLELRLRAWGIKTQTRKKTHVQRQQDKQETALKYFINTHQTELF